MIASPFHFSTPIECVHIDVLFALPSLNCERDLAAPFFPYHIYGKDLNPSKK